MKGAVFDSVDKAYSAWKRHYRSVMKRGSDRYFLRGLYRFASVAGAVIGVLLIFALVMLILGFPAFIADETGSAHWLWLYVIHCFLAIGMMGVQD